MNNRTKTGLEILQAAVIIGVLGNILLRATPWGLNVTLFNVAFVGGVVMLYYRRKPEFLNLNTIALLGAQLFFAAMFLWRDSIQLRVVDTLAILTIMSVLVLQNVKIPAQAAGAVHYAGGFIWSALNAFFAPFVLVFMDVEWKHIPKTGWSKHLFSVLRGLAIATPILLIFGALFVAADAVYEGWVRRIFNVSPDVVISHIFLTGFFAWLSAGYLRGILISKAGMEPETDSAIASDSTSKAESAMAKTEDSPSAAFSNTTILEHINKTDPPETPKTDPQIDLTDVPNFGVLPADDKKKWDWANYDNTLLPRGFTLGTIEIGIVLGLINLLFLSFVIVQVPYLFGGMDLVQNTPDFKLAEYARRGFGELVAVSAMVLPILLASHWLIRKESRAASTLFRILASIQIALLFVIMASATQRLVLLTGNLGYGLTTVRLYPMIFMGWLAIVFIWFSATVLRGARNRFAWGALWSAFAIIAATHFLNPDAFIVKTNVALMQQGRQFDAVYNAELSDDAMPALIDAFPYMNASNQNLAVRRVAKRFCEKQKEDDLRSWNYSRWQASQMLLTNKDLTEQIDCSKNYVGYYRYED